VVAEIGAHSPVAAELGGEARHRADRVEAAPRGEGGKPAGRRRGGRDSEIGAVEVAVAPARARADREDIAVRVADDDVGAEVADEPAMPAYPLAQLAAQAKVAHRIELDEAAGLDREVDVADRRADIVLFALAAQRNRRAQVEAAVLAEQA